MPATNLDSKRIVLAGASSLLGVELKSLLEESRFAEWDLRLVDEDVVAGMLTAAGGEPAVVRPVEEDSFQRARFLFFAGSADFTKANLAAARKSGAQIIDLSGGLFGLGETQAWFPQIELFPKYHFDREAILYGIPSAAATAGAKLSFALSKVGVQRISMVSYHGVSEVGSAGIEELETQTGQLLSFQKVQQAVFDAQVAFTMLDRFGEGSAYKLSAVRERLQDELRACLFWPNAKIPTVQVLHVPIFYGAGFSLCAELQSAMDGEEVVKACKDGGMSVALAGEGAPSQASVIGEKVIQFSRPERDRLQPTIWSFWGAADNILLPAANAIKLVELLS
jgi:aspartate-semialdehyde dehydrogenase